MTYVDDMSAPRKGLATLVDRIDRAARALASSHDVPASVRRDVRSIAEAVLVARHVELADTDPYLLLAMEEGAIEALVSAGAEGGRRRLRVALERMRQALRDIVEVSPVGEDVPAADVARRLTAILDVPQPIAAKIVGTSARTFQRWIAGESEPRGEEARRLRVVARVAEQLRHALTGPGVASWFTRAHPLLKGKAPLTMLDDPRGTETLVGLAAAARSAAAT